MKAKNDDRHQNGDDARPTHSSPPVAIPGAASNGSSNNSSDDRQDYFVTENAPLLSSAASPAYIPQLFLSSCLGPSASSPWETDAHLGCSPMVSRSRRKNSLRLPNLDLREAHRASAMSSMNPSHSSADFGKNKRKGRQRSASFGNNRDRERLGDISNDSSHLLLGEEILKRRTPSGLSLMDLGGGSIESDIENDCRHGGGYGATTNGHHGGGSHEATAMEGRHYSEPLKKEAGDETKPTLSTSQSCSADLNPTQPPTPTPPNLTKKKNKTLVQELKEEFASQSNPPILSLFYGIVNLFIVLPVMMSFGTIIYHDDFFRPYMSVLMKLTVVSSVVHQITFSTISSLPFAVGQVQDAGLIFLSAMASDIVSRLKSNDVDDESILATVTIGLSIYTAVLGFALVLIGKFQLASYCQLLPSSVVGGYLAFIGFFCGQAGLALMASVDVSGLSEWYKFFDLDAFMLLIPGLIGGCTIYFSLRTCRHMAVLPSCISMIMVAFYAILWATGTTVEEATEHGWINQSMESLSWTHTWDFLKLEKVVWSVLPTQTLTVLAMIGVVALSSSLDIAAIEIEMKRPLDYNYELKTVGLSNILSGITGGYTGSYIFSQTIFSLRMGIRSRLMGYTIAFLSGLFVVVPVNILAYVPNFFFGSLLIMICADLLFEWLIDVREQVKTAEYFILLSTFILLMMFGVEFGIIAGVLLHVAMDKFGYDVGKDENRDEDGVADTIAGNAIEVF